MSKKSNHIIAMIAIMLTTVFWGAGFIMSDIMLANGMTTSLINSCRFVGATIAIALVFGRRIRLTKHMLIVGIVCGAFLFGGFELQLTALKYTTAAQNGFFTASYVLFVPIMVWILYKKSPPLTIWIGVGIALLGFVIVNLAGNSGEHSPGKDQQWLGNLMTVASAVLFAFQIVISGWALRKHHFHALSFTFAQIIVAGTLFLLYFLIFHLPNTNFGIINWNATFAPLMFVVLLGTAFAYVSQINAQQLISASTTSLILSLESIVAAVLSVLVGTDKLSWQLIVGGILITSALIIVEYLPNIINKKNEIPSTINDEHNPNK